MRHNIETRSGDRSFTAFCSCGYEGRPQTSDKNARNDGDDHILAIIDPKDAP